MSPNTSCSFGIHGSCGLYLGVIITIHLCHSRLVSLCIQQQTGDKVATILSSIQDTCHGKWIQVDTTCIRQHMCPDVNAALEVV